MVWSYTHACARTHAHTHTKFDGTLRLLWQELILTTSILGVMMARITK